MARLENEAEKEIQTEVLSAVEAVEQKLEIYLDAGARWSQGETQYLSAEDQMRIVAETQSISLHSVALEWLEVLAEEKTVAA